MGWLFQPVARWNWFLKSLCQNRWYCSHMDSPFNLRQTSTFTSTNTSTSTSTSISNTAHLSKIESKETIIVPNNCLSCSLPSVVTIAGSKRLKTPVRSTPSLCFTSLPSSNVAFHQQLFHHKQYRFSSNIAETTYQQALESYKLAEDVQKQLEQRRNQQQYQAFQEQQQAKTKSIKSGVAVIKTIAKQSRTKDDDPMEIQYQQLQQQAHSFMQEAALKHGHPQALVRLGSLAWLEQGNTELAIQYYRQAGELGSADAWYNLGNLLWQEQHQQQQQHHQQQDDNHNSEGDGNTSQAMEAFLQAVKLGDADAMFFVGDQYISTQSNAEGATKMESKPRAGLELIEKAADQGHCGALYYLAMLHLEGDSRLGIEPCSSETFVQLLNSACAAGSPDALFARGHAYYHGEYKELAQNYRLALDDFLAAAGVGHPDAAVSAGAMLHRGIEGHIPQDQPRAFQLYQHAGELGSIEGWRNVVACYALGEGVKQSKETAQYIAKTMLNEEKDNDNGDDDYHDRQ